AAVAVIQGRGVGAVVRNPPGRCRARDQPPGVDECGVTMVGRDGPVGYEIVLRVEPRARRGRLPGERGRHVGGGRSGGALFRTRERQRDTERERIAEKTASSHGGLLSAIVPRGSLRGRRKD